MKNNPAYIELQQRIRELEQIESHLSARRDRESHLKNVLLAIRDVNRLIAEETEPEQLIQKICISLVRTRGYFNAWIALLDDKGHGVKACSSSGFDEGFDMMETTLGRGEFPLCMRRSLYTGGLSVTRMMLERKGYTVLTAGTPTEAVDKAKIHSGPIEMRVTDLVMPEMNGRDLAGQVHDLYPGIRLLFMSGYTANVIANKGILEDGVAFVQKPFSMADLTEKVRGVLYPEKHREN